MISLANPKKSTTIHVAIGGRFWSIMCLPRENRAKSQVLQSGHCVGRRRRKDCFLVYPREELIFGVLENQRESVFGLSPRSRNHGSGKGRSCNASRIVGFSRRNLRDVSFSTFALASSPKRK